MLFNSITFILFFVVVLGLNALPFSWTIRKAILLAASYLFYAAWNPPFIVLLWFSTILDWWVGKALGREHPQPIRRLLLGISLCGNLGLLCYFKYSEFFLNNFIALINLLGWKFTPIHLGIILPLGISFYTFQTLSYTLDIYRVRLKPWPSWLDYALFVTFFPQLVAGPIVRASEFLPQCQEPRRATRTELSWGLTLFILGLFTKVVVADAFLAPIVDRVYGAVGGIHAQVVSAMDAWLGTFAMYGQIFSDFSGYSLCAIGLARCLGFWLPDNFRAPMAARGFSDFWMRWHMTLTRYVRDYVYFPLARTRPGGLLARVYILIPMLLIGLWHGPAWTYVAWGGVMGLLVILQNSLRRWFGRSPVWSTPMGQVVLMLITWLLVAAAGVFFRASGDMAGALSLLASMFGLQSGGQPVLEPWDHLVVIMVMVSMVACHWLRRDETLEQLADQYAWPMRALVISLMLTALILYQGETRVFVYFQF